jgi:hypothetical protein
MQTFSPLSCSIVSECIRTMVTVLSSNVTNNCIQVGGVVEQDRKDVGDWGRVRIDRTCLWVIPSQRKTKTRRCRATYQCSANQDLRQQQWSLWPRIWSREKDITSRASYIHDSSSRTGIHRVLMTTHPPSPTRAWTLAAYIGMSYTSLWICRLSLRSPVPSLASPERPILPPTRDREARIYHDRHKRVNPRYLSPSS